MQRIVPFLALLGFAGCAREIPTATLMLEGVTVVDVQDGTLVPDATLVVAGDRIEAMGAPGDFRVPRGTPVVSAPGTYAIPGLWDMHVHALWSFWYEPFLKLFVANGITGFRDTWGDLELAERLRSERASGERPVPRFLVAGNLVDGPDPIWPSSISVATPGRAREVVDSLLGAGAGFIKVYSLLSAEAFRAIADQSRRAGIPFAGHVPASVRAADAAAAGLWTLEHLYGVPEGCSSAEDEILADFVAARTAQAQGRPAPSRLEGRRRRYRRVLSTQDPERCRRLLQVLKDSGTWLVPTLVTLRGQAFANDPGLTDDPRIRFLPSELRESWSPDARPSLARRTEEDWRLAREMLSLDHELTGRAHRAGVGILAGSDTPNPWAFPGSGLHDELELLVEAGLAPLEALRAATLEPARFLEATDSMGTVEAGKVADLVLLDSNPLEDIGNVRRIHAVVLAGKLLSRADLDDLLDEVIEAVRP